MTELRPPEQWAHLRLHVLVNQTGEEIALTWNEKYRTWHLCGDLGRTAEGLARDGYRYIGPAVAITMSDEQIEHLAHSMFITHYVDMDNSSLEWANFYWNDCSTADHKGDCPIAEFKGPITCDRCVIEEFRTKARAVLAALIGEE